MHHYPLFVFTAMLSFLLSIIVSGSKAGNHDFICYWASGQLLDKGANPYDRTAVITLERSEGWLQQESMVMANPPLALPLAMPIGVLTAPDDERPVDFPYGELHCHVGACDTDD